jgi:aspartyl-tRNA(Asn)/glutamyl-tRNA(Gln) amidotransferase subunit B
MNSFRSVVRALRYEENRQREVVRAGGALIQETRGWVEATGVTVSQRTKEQAHDYRYFPEPDLPPLTVTADDTIRLAETIGELPQARRDRYVREYQLAAQDASLLSSELALARYFEETIGAGATAERARVAANWLVNDVIGLQKSKSLPDDLMPITSEQLRDLIELVQSGKVTGRAAKDLLVQLETGEDVSAAAARLNLLSLDDHDAIRAAAMDVLEAFPVAVEDYRGGKTAAIGRLIGETIKRTGGRANPDAVRTVLTQLLET